ncbi:MAG: nucleotidyltransferase family protein [Lachnospiraceae bacterium]|nr:nucleotidyltransferase family protein [Lachnospiraceae bacterium]
MNAESYRSAVLNIAYLAACAVNRTAPDRERTDQMDPDALLQAAQRHLLSGITAMALESAGITNEKLTRAKGNAIRKVILLNAEKDAILQRFEAAGIWYMPLKGALLKDLYPSVGMRQMSDIDILIDPDRVKEAGKIMSELGYQEEEATFAHIAYVKKPLYNIELHRQLFSPAIENKSLNAYYRSVKDRILPDEDRRFGFHFTDEDFYLYMTAHEYKHYAIGGTGLRSLLDTYVYCTQKGPAMDWDYIRQELEKLGIADFEAQNRCLAMDLFQGKTLDPKEEEMLEYIIFSGTYGTISNEISNHLTREGNGAGAKLKYLFRRLYPPMDVVRSIFPTFAKYPVLLPFLPLYRLFRGRKRNAGRLTSELKELIHYKKKTKEE